MNGKTHIKTKKSAMFDKKTVKINMLQIKNLIKLGAIFIINFSFIEVLYMVYVILSIFHNGSNYDYHFIIKELAKKFEK